MSAKKYLLFIFVALLCVGFSSAMISGNIKIVKNQIFPWEEAEFVVEITNKGASLETLTYQYPDSADWSLLSDPVYTKRDIKPGETLTTTVKLMPTDESHIKYRQYLMKLRVYSADGEDSYEDDFNVFVRDPSIFMDYAPIVNIDGDISSENIDPRQSATLTVTLDNKNRLNLSDFKVEIKSQVNPENNQAVTLPLGPLAKTEAKFSINYADTQPPVTDYILIQASIPSRNYTFDPVVKVVKIVSYSKVEVSEVQSESFLKTKTEIIFFNNGNIASTEPYKLPTSFLRQLFTTAEPKPVVLKQGGRSYLEWEVYINPQETSKITVVENYKPLFAFVIIVSSGYGIYWVLLKKD